MHRVPLALALAGLLVLSGCSWIVPRGGPQADADDRVYQTGSNLPKRERSTAQGDVQLVDPVTLERPAPVRGPTGGSGR